MGRNCLKGPEGDRINAVLAAAGYNFSLLLRWLAELLRALILKLVRTNPSRSGPLVIPQPRFFRQSTVEDLARADLLRSASLIEAWC